jgi:two-component system, LytTR family, response regulator
MQILIVDDEELAHTRLKRMLESLRYNDIHEAIDANNALQMCQKNRYDIVFLDINMPDINGLELGYEIKYLSPSTAIIYQSAYDEHALKAYDIGTIGYLVKPYSTEDVQKNIQRVTATQNNSDLIFMSKTGENYLLLKPKDIYYIKADLSEIMVRSKAGFSYLSQKISDIEKKLEPFHFFRIHRSYLININEIKDITTIEQSKLRFRFKNCDDEIESSKDGAKSFREAFNN